MRHSITLITIQGANHAVVSAAGGFVCFDALPNGERILLFDEAPNKVTE